MDYERFFILIGNRKLDWMIEQQNRGFKYALTCQDIRDKKAIIFDFFTLDQCLAFEKKLPEGYEIEMTMASFVKKWGAANMANDKKEISRLKIFYRVARVGTIRSHLKNKPVFDVKRAKEINDFLYKVLYGA